MQNFGAARPRPTAPPSNASFASAACSAPPHAGGSAGRRPQHLHRDRLGRPGRPRRHPPHPSRKIPTARILVTGCYAQRAPEEIAALPGVSWVVGNSHKHQLPKSLASAEAASSRCEKLSRAPTAEHLRRRRHLCPHRTARRAGIRRATGRTDKTRPNLKVQDGCDNRCSFCMIPCVRGQSRSLQLDRVMREVNALVDAGYREIVISAASTWAAGAGTSTPRGSASTDLLRAIAGAHRRSRRLRISSVEPMDWTDDLIA